MQRIVFDFDVVSPYAWLAFERLPQALEGISQHVEYRPLLFAGLLKAWGTRAPVDVAPRKAWIFRQCAWLAQRQGSTFAPPALHPFNPLALRRAVELVMRHVWARDGADPNDADALRTLAAAVAPLRDPNADAVKAELRERTEDAVRAGVFGVPSFRLDDGQAFWGQDSLDMVVDALRTQAARGGSGA